MNATESGTPRDKQWLQECCELVKNKMPSNYSFVVFGFPTHGSGQVFYASNATRESVVPALKVWIGHSDATFGVHHSAPTPLERIEKLCAAYCDLEEIPKDERELADAGWDIIKQCYEIAAAENVKTK